MFDTRWYTKVFIPLVQEATRKGINCSSRDRFLVWINATPDRKSRHAGIQHFVNDVDDWEDVVAEALTLEV